jgi:hypothetical protein
LKSNCWPWLLVVLMADFATSRTSRNILAVTYVTFMALLSFSSRVWAAEGVSNFLWARQLGDHGENQVLGLAVDKSGNVFVTGFINFCEALVCAVCYQSSHQ